MTKPLLFFSILICNYNYSNAQSLDSAVRHAADNFMASGTRVGFSVGIIKNGQIFRYHFGTTQKGKQITPTDKTIYEIGSVTKTFTSLLLAEAVIENKVKLTDDIRKYLNEKYPNLQYNDKPIQILHLANLTSGLPNNLPELMPDTKNLDADAQLFSIHKFHDAYTKTQFLADLHKVKLTAAPGSAPSHSNTAAELLGFILENIYGTTYSALLKRYITERLNMGNTYAFLPESKQALYAPGYNDKGTLMPEIPRDAGSAGVLRSSLADMINYVVYQLQEKDEALIMSHMPTWGNPESFAIGFNWSVKTNFDGKRKLWTSGGTFGHTCYISFYPERNIGMVILTNESDNGAEDRLSDLAQTIYNEIYFTPFERSSEAFGFSATVNTLLNFLNKYEFKNAVKVAGDLKKQNPSFKLLEDELNSWGYYFYFKDQKAKALEIFKLNVSLYPQSANTYDSLADTYESIGNKELAIENYKKELRLNPGNTDVALHVKKLEGN